MRAPSVTDLAERPEVGPLAIAEMALVVLARLLRALHPDIDRVARPGDDALTAAARQLADDCDLILYSLDRYGDQLGCSALRPLSSDPDWPF
jgi:hypothetical protein